MTDVTRRVCADCIPAWPDWPVPPLAEEPVPLPVPLPLPVPVPVPVPVPEVDPDAEDEPLPLRLLPCRVPRISTWLFRYFFNSLWSPPESMKRLFIDDCVLPDPEVPLVAVPDPLVPVPVEPEPEAAPEAPLPLPMRALVSMNCAPVDRLEPVWVPDPVVPDPVLPDPVLPDPVADPALPVPLVPALPPAMSAFCRHPVTVTVWPC